MARPHDNVPRIVEEQPPELIVYDREQPCPYLPNRVSRLPLRLPSRPLSREELADRLERGDRRQGYVLYRPTCPKCRACEPIRLPVLDYELTNAQRRILKRGDQRLTVRLGPAVVDRRRVEIYNTHKLLRGLQDGQPPIDEDGYRDFLVASCCDTFELAYYQNERLIGVAICDRAADSISAVYCCYDPAYQRYSIGTYSILKQLELCREWGLSYLYLGLYIADCETMTYKARFLPHERRLRGHWVRFEVPHGIGGPGATGATGGDADSLDPIDG